jgi:hypothetical protein
MATLHAWGFGSHLYGPKKHEVHLHTTRLQLETVKMAQVNQGLRARSALSSAQGKCSCGRAESQGSLQLFASCTSYWRTI